MCNERVIGNETDMQMTTNLLTPSAENFFHEGLVSYRNGGTRSMGRQTQKFSYNNWAVKVKKRKTG